ncbi:MAG: hypothetical protein M1350_06145, partial [Actinobacteria bacterium]|nr:hypothetical protein [Actinomycetota bacterium]
HLVSDNLFGVIETYAPPLVLLVVVLEVANGMVVDLCRATAVVSTVSSSITTPGVTWVILALQRYCRYRSRQM